MVFSTKLISLCQLAPENIDARFNQAVLYKKRGDMDLSRQTLKGIIEEVPSNTKALILMARLSFLQRRCDEAIEWSDKVFAYDRVSITTRELQLEVYSEMGDWENADFAAQRLVGENPYNTDYLIGLASIARQLEDDDLAQNVLSRLYPIRKQDPEKLRELAAIQVRFQNPSAARKCLEQALLLDEGSYFLRLDLARLDASQGKYAEAQSVAEELQRHNGVQVDTALLLGDIALARDEPLSARQHFLAAFQLNTYNMESIARLYALSSHGIEAREFTDLMESNLKKSLLPVMAVRLMADSYLGQGKMQQAALYYEKLLDLDEFAADPAILNNLANIYAEHDLDKALAIALRGLAAAGENSAAYRN